MTNAIPTIGKITPRDYQWHDMHLPTLEHIREQIGDYIKERKQPEPAIVEGYVGCGKTIAIGALANHCSQKNYKCLIIARQGELIKQNSEECFNMDAPTSVYSASLNSKSTYYSVVAGTEGTIANALETDFSNWLPLVIQIDEAHMVDWEDILNGGQSQFARIIRHFNMLADRMQDKSPNKPIPRPVIIGFTGSPYRGTQSIIGPYWTKKLCEIGREYLVNNGYLVPTLFGFGHDDVQYDLSEFDSVEEFGTGDFTSSQLEQMQEKMSLSATQSIMREVMALTKDRNGVLITCAGIRHCEEAASVLPAGTWGIITSKTPDQERMDMLDAAKVGKIKYILQIGCLTTGVNVPLWDTSVILRRIGSLTLLVQLLGRGMRLLKPEHERAGLTKNDHLVLDYAGTMPAMINMFNDPILEEAELSRAKEAKQTLDCPKCGELNSEHARRCIGRDASGERCDQFFQSRTCDDLKRGDFVVSRGCGAENDITARECRICGNTLIDPNNVLGKHYSDDDWKDVQHMEIEITGKGETGIKVRYFLDSFDVNGRQEIATSNYWAINGGGSRVWKSKFLSKHVVGGYGMVNKVAMMKPREIMINKRLFKTPKKITHRINGKGESLVTL